jgi:predicted dienelactone hydrolase
MPRPSVTGAVLLGLLMGGLAQAGEPVFPVGETQRLIHPQAPRYWRGAKTEGLVTRIWYPADPATPQTPHDIGAPGQAIFQGHPVAINAALAATNKPFPVLMLSHGTGGSADSLDWLGSALAADGYVVVGLNHPGNTALEPLTPDGMRLWWERATDVSDALDALLADPVFGSRLDRTRIGAIGFSLGGYTVLELAGARTDVKAFQDFCASPAADGICHPPELDRVAAEAMPPSAPPPERAASLERSGRSYRDPRIKAVFAIAPGLGEAFDPASLSAIDIPVEMLAGTADSIAPLGTNIQRIASFMPGAAVVMIPAAAHYTFLDLCVPAAVDRLPLLCQDGAGVDRRAVHDQAIEAARAFFARTLPTGAP